MSDDIEVPPIRPWYIFRSRGANRITHANAPRISEVFDKDAAPPVGAICVAVQAGYDGFDDSDDENEAEGDFVVALAVVRGVTGVASGAVRATLAPIHRMLTPISLDLLQGIPIGLGEIPANFYTRELSPETASALIIQLGQIDPGVAFWLAQVSGNPRDFSVDVRQARREAEDAVKLAAQFAEFELPEDAFVSPQSGGEDETLLQTVLNAGYEYDLEEELLPLDLQRFDGKLVGEQRAASVSVFTDRWNREKLVVMSVNKKPIELELGVDLLYWDTIHNSFTFVQYKRLEKVATGDPGDPSEWAYLRKGEIEKQLKLMPTGRGSSAKADDWRAFETPFWFKFVRGDAGSVLDNKTLKGMHVPADWLRVAMKENLFASGPRGGFRINYGNAKYLGRTVFAQLVSRGFVGTAGSRSNAFKKVLHSKDRELIIAVRTEWESDDDRLDVATASEVADGGPEIMPPVLPF